MKVQGPGGGDRSSAEAASRARCSGKGWGEGREKRPSAKRAKAAEEKRVAREADMKGGVRQGRDERATARVLLPPPQAPGAL